MKLAHVTAMSMAPKLWKEDLRESINRKFWQMWFYTVFSAGAYAILFFNQFFFQFLGHQ